ncbi:uncharacterized protein TNCV_1542351 [Trichonephila clavipes]|nr:uncharacterized protein TNCV_1542351 [Trichonephila clavipes]
MPNEDQYFRVIAKRSSRNMASDLSGQLSAATGGHPKMSWRSPGRSRSTSAMSTEYAFMDDKVYFHRANIVKKYLQPEFITPIVWPTCSPGFHAVHHVLHILCKCVSYHQPPPICVPELRSVFPAEGSNLLQDQLDTLILSMPRYCMY